ncbi:uncharacterized protein FYW49_011712 [Xenentodon cancila]
MKSLWLLFLVGLSTGFINEKIFVLSQSMSSTADDLYMEGQTSGGFPIDDEDNDTDGSGSGSGDYAFGDHEELLQRFLNLSNASVSKEMPQPTLRSPQNPTTTEADGKDLALAEQDSDDWTKQNEMPSAKPTSVIQSHSSGPSNEPLDEATTQFMDISVSKNDNTVDDWNDETSKDLTNEVEKDIIADGGRGGRLHKANPQEVTSENMWERTEVLAAVIACGVVGFLCAVFLLLLLAYRMKKKDEGSYDLGDTKLSATAYHKAPTKEFYA